MSKTIRNTGKKLQHLPEFVKFGVKLLRVHQLYPENKMKTIATVEH